MKNRFSQQSSNSLMKGVLIALVIIIIIMISIGLFTGCSDNSYKVNKTIEKPGIPEMVGHHKDQIKYWYSLDNRSSLLADTDSLLKFEDVGIFENYFLKDNYCYMSQINIVIKDDKEATFYIEFMGEVLKEKHYTKVMLKDEGLIIVTRTDNPDKFCMILMYRPSDSKRGVLSWTFYNKGAQIDPDKLSNMFKYY